MWLQEHLPGEVRKAITPLTCTYTGSQAVTQQGNGPGAPEVHGE